jgi:S-adenosylmethionine hydrolase
VIDHISQTYADVQEGEKLALFNSAGYLEIAINKGNAAGLLGLKGFTEKNSQSRQILQNQLFYQTVRINFE